LNPDWPHIAGRIDGGRHILPVRVYFEDTDAGSLVYHASFIRFMERGRTDFVRLLGVNQSEMADGEDAAFFVVRRIAIDYLKPGRLDDLLEVATSCAEIGRASLTLEQSVTREGVALAKASVLIVLVSREGRPLRIGEAIRDALLRIGRDAEG
jgi:acyl-CoA thioester hydrolase